MANVPQDAESERESAEFRELSSELPADAELD